MELEGIFALTLFMSGFLSVWVIGMDSKETDFLRQFSEHVKKSSRAQLWENLTAQSRFGLGIAAVILLAAALGVNISTWFSSGIVRHRNPLIGLALGMGILIFASVVVERWRWRMLGSRKQAFTFPRWCKPVLAALLVYVASEFAFDMARLYRQPMLSNSQNEPVKLEMTAQEQTQKQMRIVRNFSGVWILLSAASAAALLLMKDEPYQGPFGKFNRVVQQL